MMACQHIGDTPIRRHRLITTTLHCRIYVDTIICVEITYDPVKNAANIERRGLSFDQVAELDWSSAVITEDTRKAYGERRHRVFGYIGERLYAAVFTTRGTVVHVISFRKANKREVKRHG